MLKQQAGFSMLGWAAILGVGGVIILCAVKILPIYFEDTYVKDALKSLASNNDNILDLESADIRRQLQKYSQVNTMGSVQAKSFKVQRYDGRVIVNSVYEIRIPIALNIDAVMSFKHQLDTQNPDTCCEYVIDKWDES